MTAVVVRLQLIEPDLPVVSSTVSVKPGPTVDLPNNIGEGNNEQVPSSSDRPPIEESRDSASVLGIPDLYVVGLAAACFLMVILLIWAIKRRQTMKARHKRTTTFFSVQQLLSQESSLYNLSGSTQFSATSSSTHTAGKTNGNIERYGDPASTTGSRSFEIRLLQEHRGKSTKENM